ncbi:hypothetical protein RSJ22_12235 [Clostridium botulinum]|uniref:hypothetical protein n=1 Tax=Clostridium botulinum TaxID=1491 RepID=UPI000462F2C0|nr:hypothetical protein [Clostridium botulinum]APQ72855.1 hypothetical protein RSJ9_2710 [Clostridium botulinum]AUN22167.1 hypothetical protein RSJ22_12235 [Clostridium botulinum]MBY6965298.1 hypothetical protein [Clostridium botulinum]MCJ8173198.1 hypothetical protein [Clostridium botulinum]QDY21641.1 hypothetical protein CGQ39_11985 [Clostridium botulinum]
MQEIKEIKDLSKQVLAVDIESPIFKNMMDTLNGKIIEVIKNVYNEEFESGDIALKMTLSVPKTIKEIPAQNEFGDPIVKTIKYKALQFKHNITSTLKKVDKDEDYYYGDKELKKDEEGNFIEEPIQNPQVTMFD